MLSAFTSIYHDFGCKTVEPKTVLKILPKVFGHADKNVRAEAQNLTVELYRYLREGIKPLFWNDLKPVQQTDIEKLFEKVKDEPVPRPERLLRSQQARQAAVAAAPADDGAYEEDIEEEDAGEIDLAPEAVDVFAKIPADFQERIMSSKWKDRKEALDDLQVAVNVPSIAEGPFDDVIRALAKSMKDANVAVVTLAANCVELIAKGLRRSFNKYRSTIMEPMFERLKERKQSVTDAIAAALDAVASTANLSEYLENTLEYFKHKNPLVKLESTRFVIRALKASKDAPSLPEVKLVADAASKLLADSTEVQRSAGAEILGVLLKIMGDRIMTVHLEPLDDIRKAKVKEFADTAEVKAKYKPKAAAPPPRPAAAPVGKKMVKKPGPAAVKRPAAAPVEELAPTPLRPKPTARPTLPKPGAPRGLKPPSGLAPAKKLPAPASQSSPRRNVYSPPFEDDPPPVAQPARGLAGRQLSKPTAQPAPAPQYTNPALPTMESIEMEEIRAEVIRLRSHNERLAREAASLATQVQELEDQNAQLIEDHTRDVLSIKAKETQLVRARSDAESAEQTSAQLQREVDRLKRELGRTARASSPRVSDYEFAPVSDAIGGYGVNGGDHENQIRARHNMSPLREGKENLNLPGARRGEDEKPAPGFGRSAMLSPAAPRTTGLARPTSRATAGSSQSPVRTGSRIGEPPSLTAPGPKPLSRNGTGDVASAGSSIGSGSSSTAARGQEGGQESWRRAAEVTQNLKARIELMRVSCGVSISCRDIY